MVTHHHPIKKLVDARGPFAVIYSMHGLPILSFFSDSILNCIFRMLDCVSIEFIDVLCSFAWSLPGNPPMISVRIQKTFSTPHPLPWHPPPWGRYPLLGADHTRQKSRPHLPEKQIGKFRHRLSPGPETILATRILDWGPTCVLPLFSQCSPTLFPNPNPILINMSYPPTQAEPPAGPKAMLYTRSPASNLNEDSLLNQRSYRP